MKKSIFLLAILGLLTAAPLHASHIKGGNEVTIAEPVDGNLYTAGGDIRINAPIAGDLVCAGGDIWINELVAADVILVGGEAKITNKIGGDVRLASGNLTIAADVAGDLVVAGGELTIEQGVTIGGDVIIAGGKVIFDGATQGNIKMVGGEMIFNGKTAGKMELKGGKIYFNGEVKGDATLAAQELNIGSNAAFYSTVQYWNEKGDANFDGHLYEGATANYKENLKFKTKLDREVVKQGLVAFAIFRFAAAALLMTLLVALFGKFFTKHSGYIRENVGNHAGTGLLFLLGVPVVAALAFATVIGIPVGFIMLSGYGIALMLANSLTAVVAAYELKKYLNRDWNKGILIAVALGAFVALRLVGMLAIPGKFIVFAATAIALGAVINWMRKGWQKADDTPDASPSANNDEPSDIV
ncbi:MAG: hypothetical protein ACK4TA_23155 [Saprospiraceae bacterium]